MATLLIVDDETALVGVLREAFELQLPGIVVHTASDWDEALGIARSLESLDLLLTDHNLRTHSGIELCLAVRIHHPELRALIYTGKATPEVEAAAQAIGARVIWKPQRLGILIEEIREQLEQG